MKHKVFYTSEEIHRQVHRLAASIDDANVDYYLVLTVLKGAAIFSSDLVRAMRTDTELAYISAYSYIQDFTPGDTLTINPDPELDVRGRDVLIVEDIIDTGRTLQQLHTTITQQDPQSLNTVTLVNKTNRRETPFEPSYTGFSITDEFIYGYGLDWNQRYRNLPYIAIANPSGGTEKRT